MCVCIYISVVDSGDIHIYIYIVFAYVYIYPYIFIYLSTRVIPTVDTLFFIPFPYPP